MEPPYKIGERVVLKNGKDSYKEMQVIACEWEHSWQYTLIDPYSDENSTVYADEIFIKKINS